MDGGPFGTPRPTSARVANRQESAPRQPVAEESPKPVQHAAVPQHRAASEKKQGGKGLKTIIIVIVLVLLVAVGGWFAWTKLQSAGSAIDSSKYQAVFFTNGQVYFGKLSVFGSDTLKLKDVFYLQTDAGSDSQNPQKSSSDEQTNVQLVKLGNEIHGPEDEMIISKDQVLFYENLKSDGKVAQSIEQYNNK